MRTNLFIIHWNVGMKLYFLRKSKQTCSTPSIPFSNTPGSIRFSTDPVIRSGGRVGTWNRELADKKACFSCCTEVRSRVGLWKYAWAGNYVQYRTVTKQKITQNSPSPTFNTLVSMTLFLFCSSPPFVSTNPVISLTNFSMCASRTLGKHSEWLLEYRYAVGLSAAPRPLWF